MKEEFLGKIKLTHGCIRQDNSLTSRDGGYHEYFDNTVQAKQSLESHERFYHSIGYKVWFSQISEWNGTSYVEIKNR